MSASEVVERWIENFNKHDAGAAASQYATDAVVHDPQYPEPLSGRAAIEQDFADFFAAFPDVRSARGDLLEAGNLFAAEFMLTGTHQGPLAGPDGEEIPPTGRSMEVRGATFARLNDSGEVVEEHRYYDLAGLMMQLGIGPGAEAAVS